MDYVPSLKYQWQPYIQCLYRSLPATIQHQTIKVIPIANINTPVAISLKIKITTFILYFFKNGYKKYTYAGAESLWYNLHVRLIIRLLCSLYSIYLSRSVLVAPGGFLIITFSTWYIAFFFCFF